jgi:hypothetical protein
MPRKIIINSYLRILSCKKSVITFIKYSLLLLFIMSTDKSIQYDGELIKVVIIPGFKQDEPWAKIDKILQEGFTIKSVVGYNTNMSRVILEKIR